MTSPTVEILRCPGCGAAVPLGDGDAARCLFCSTSVVIPSDQRAVRDATRADADAHARAVALVREVGRPPSAILQAFAISPWSLATGGFVLVTFAGYFLFLFVGTRLANAVFHVRLLDVVSEEFAVVAPIAIALVIGFAGLAAGAYTLRRAVSLRAVQGAFAARPPQREGGPASCRACNAPLTVPADADGVICDYCRADNLVRIPPAWIATVTTGTAVLGRAVDEVLAAHRAELAKVRRRLRARMLAWAIVSAIVLGALARALSNRDPVAALGRWRIDWRADVRDDRTMRAHRGLLRDVVTPYHADHPLVDRCEGALLNPAVGAVGTVPACDAKGCKFHWIVALRHGERLTAKTTDLPAGSILVFVAHIGGTGLTDGDFVGLRDDELTPDHPVTFEGKVSGWYGLWLHVPGLTPEHGRSFCVELSQAP
ncbi:MAG: hypothetical protein ACHREM_07770 [Polyangiales bacterium]